MRNSSRPHPLADIAHAEADLLIASGLFSIALGLGLCLAAAAWLGVGDPKTTGCVGALTALRIVTELHRLAAARSRYVGLVARVVRAVGTRGCG